MENLINGIKDIWLVLSGNTGVLGLIVLILLKIIPNEDLKAFGTKIGTIATLGLSKFKGYQVFENWFINGFDNFWEGIMIGLRSDNVSNGDNSNDSA